MENTTFASTSYILWTNKPLEIPKSSSVFYNDGFAKADHALMESLYRDDATFEDEAFGKLDCAHVRGMWAMLLGKYKPSEGTFPDFSVSNITGTAEGGSAHWEAKYPSPTGNGRPVHNRIDAKFVIEDDLIVSHVDHFDFHDWAHQALGAVGYVFGGFSFFHNKAIGSANEKLETFLAKQQN